MTVNHKVPSSSLGGSVSFDFLYDHEQSLEIFSDPFVKAVNDQPVLYFQLHIQLDYFTF